MSVRCKSAVNSDQWRKPRTQSREEARLFPYGSVFKKKGKNTPAIFMIVKASNDRFSLPFHMFS